MRHAEFYLYPGISKWVPRVTRATPKVNKFGSNVTWKTVKLRQQLKKWNLLKTKVFILFSAHPSSESECDFHTQIVKKQPWNQYFDLVPTNLKQMTKLVPDWTLRGPSNP
jgi:hypothetical protein